MQRHGVAVKPGHLPGIALFAVSKFAQPLRAMTSMSGLGCKAPCLWCAVQVFNTDALACDLSVTETRCLADSRLSTPRQALACPAFCGLTAEARLGLRCQILLRLLTETVCTVILGSVEPLGGCIPGQVAVGAHRQKDLGYSTRPCS